MKNLLIIANWMQGTALSGGDKILIELTRRWLKKLHISFFISMEGDKICRQEGLELDKKRIWSSDFFSGFYLIDGIYRVIWSVFHAFRITINKGDIVLSSSDFLPDSIPAFILKLRRPDIKWVASFYLFAPKPWDRKSPYKGAQWLLGLTYWLSQLPAYYLIKKFADLVFVTSQPDVNSFITKKRSTNEVIVVRGGVDVLLAKEYFKSKEFIFSNKRPYDACFVGRFHYQKGILELIQIWEKVCKKQPHRRLAIIGVGPLEQKTRKLIGQLKIQNNVDLLGFLSGGRKFDIFKKSKIVLHPATYDSGGMAAAEAMAWGLPGVSFDLEALKTYYPKGILKTRCFDFNEFSENILYLLTNPDAYQILSQEALHLINEEWDWDKQAQKIFHQLTGDTPIKD